MKLMTLVLATLSVVAVTSVNAQPQHREPKSAEEMAQMETERMTKSLELTDQQSDQIYDINLKYAENRQAKMADMKQNRESEGGVKEQGKRPNGARPGAPKDGRSEEMRGSQRAMLSEIVAVLTTDQIVKLIEMRDNRHSKQMHRGGDRGQRGRRGERGCPIQHRDRPNRAYQK